MKKINTFIVLLISFLLSGCAYTNSELWPMGPYQDNNLEKLILESTSLKNEKIILFSPGFVQFDKKGTKDTRPIVINNTLATVISGILVLTDKNMFIQQWDKEKMMYKTVLTISFEEINDIALEIDGRGRTISALLKNGRYVTFSFGAVWQDAELALKAYALMPENLKSPK